MVSDRREIEALLRSTFGAWNHYRLRVWHECRSFDSASETDRIRIAKEILANRYQGDLIWAWGGSVLLLGEIQNKLGDVDPHVRQDAAIALADFGRHAGCAVPMLLERLRSTESTSHDRTLAAWALPRIGVSSEEALPILLAVLDETADQEDADELRRYLAEAIESLNDSFRTLVPLARRCLRDRFWKCRMHGLFLVERLGERHRRLLQMLVPNVEPLLNEELAENRVIARQIVDGFSKSESQN